ncbi:hypothetical protein Lepto7376_0403 [[Leptolyngbya] sp. PCC 7376]|uniref:CU044_2847 family protein n=1 Tax=[Leptolyngbya] sp. PCC 7376 TaxID=111781 RepID=UPI00029EDBE3|nr:CU044_2847 family protein [[Leptolyngbya] sp. PCC 7376]AFY36840.1 hypothetical protein Lepto7376_0403 [[Leptolyngbya] sp. PCC 7376]
MANLVPIQLDDGTIIHIQVQGDPAESPAPTQERTRDDVGDGEKGLRDAISGVGRAIANPTETTASTFENIENTIRGYTHYTLNAFRKVANANIDKVTLEFGIQIEGKAGIPYITEGTAASNLKVTVECSFPDDNSAQSEEE